VPDNHEFRLGAYSGLLAVIMVVALSVMAIIALEPRPVQTAFLTTPDQVHQASPLDDM
jgi:hypothetical protein